MLDLNMTLIVSLVVISLLALISFAIKRSYLLTSLFVVLSLAPVLIYSHYIAKEEKMDVFFSSISSRSDAAKFATSNYKACLDEQDGFLSGRTVTCKVMVMSTSVQMHDKKFNNEVEQTLNDLAAGVQNLGG
jgi:hypothetical protein